MNFWLGYKYAFAYIYIQVSVKEIICILNIFAVEYIFFLRKEDWNRVEVSELKESSKVYISYLNLMQNIRHTSFLLVLQKVLRETEAAVTS